MKKQTAQAILRRINSGEKTFTIGAYTYVYRDSETANHPLLVGVHYYYGNNPQFTALSDLRRIAGCEND